MLDKLKDTLVCEMEDVSKDGVKTGNIEYIAKLAETYKNLNKAEKEEVETMMYDERMEEGRGRYSRSYRDHDGYGDERYGEAHRELYGRGRGPYARRDTRGRYADAMIPLEDRYADYRDTKRRYRASGDGKEEMHKGLEMVMKYMCKLIEELYNDLDSEEERRIMDRYIRKLSELQ